MNYSQAVIHHFGSGIADFIYKANGDFIWNGPGEKPTNEELEQWDQERLIAVTLSEQTQTIINLLNETQHKVDGDYDYPDDVEAWKVWRGKLKAILRSGKIQELPGRPY